LLLEQGNKDFIKGKRKGKENDVIGPWGRDFIKGKGQKKKKKTLCYGVQQGVTR